MVPNNFLAQTKNFKIEGPGINPGSGTEATTALEKALSSIIGTLTLVAVIWFTIQIILAGFGLMTAQGDEKKVIENRSRLTNGILGLFIVVIAMGLAALLSKLLGLQSPFDLNKFFTSINK